MSRRRHAHLLPIHLLFGLLATITLLLTSCGGDVTTSSDDTEAAEDTSGEELAGSNFDGDTDDAMEDDDAMADEAAFDVAEAEEAEAPEVADAAVEQGQDTASSAGDDEGADASRDLGASGATATQQTAADFGRKIIFTADITVEVDDVAAAGQEATDIIAGVGGFVFGQQTEGGSRPQSVLTFKVLPENFDRAVEALGNVGELRNQVISADDVTERVVNLETRMEVAELGVDRLRATLEGTQDLEDYAELERLLLERESELELMRGQLRTLQDRIDLATITVRLIQDAVNHSMALSTTIYHAQDSGASCPGNDSSRVESGTDITICFEVVNTGEEPIADLVFIDTALGIDSTDDLIVVFGELDRLDGGQSLMLAYETTADRRAQLRPKVTGRAITEDGEPAGPAVDARGEGFLDPFEPETDPGFIDGFDAGVDVLQGIWTAAKVVIGFLLPMLVLLAILVPVVWFVRRRLQDRQAAQREAQQAVHRANQPPPPTTSVAAPGPADEAGAGPAEN